MFKQQYWPLESVSESSPLIEVCERVYFPRKLNIRSDDTRKQYRIAIRSFGEFLGRIPTISDLDDDLVTMFIKSDSDDNSAATTNGKISRLRALWTWLAKRDCVKKWPTFSSLSCPIRQPKAWREAELCSLYRACREKRGRICGVPAGIWWSTLVGLIWNCGERIGAVRRLHWSNVKIEDLWVNVPFEIRKGRTVERGYRLWPETADMLRVLKKYTPAELVFPFPYDTSTLYNRYKAILQQAGLPTDRKSKFHCLRVSHATWIKVMGGDPQEALGHTSMAVTKRSYLDPSIIQTDAPDLFRLNEHPPVKLGNGLGKDHSALN